MKAYIKLIEEGKQFWNEVVSKNGKSLEGRGVTIWVDDEGEQTDSLYNPPNSPRSYILSQDEDVLFETNEELPVIEEEEEIEVEIEEVSFNEEKLIEATDKITFEMVEGLAHGDTIKLNDEFELYRYSGDGDSSFDLSYEEEDEDEEEVNVVVVNHSESGTEVFMVMLNGTEIELETL